MRTLRKLFAVFSLVLAISVAFVPSYIYATETTEQAGSNGSGEGTTTSKNENTYTFDTHDAVVDIMNNDRYVGAISSISWLTDRVDRIFMQIISIVAFFIISTSLLKNACAGAYCANPKFWNKVDEAHQKSDAWNLAKIGETARNFKNLSPAGVKDAILGIVPNIKALTEFEDAEIEPKHYFMRAIPQMLGCIIIGIFIYNGYYRDTASSVGAVGSEICNRVFASVDPTSFVDKLTQTSGTPDNIYKNDPSIQGQYIYQISSDLYRAVITQSSMITTKEGKTTLMRNCENLAYQWTLDGSVRSQTWGIGSNSEYEYSLNSLSIDLLPNNAHTSGFVNPLTADANGDLSFAFYVNGDDVSVPNSSDENFEASTVGGAWGNILSTANDLDGGAYGSMYMQGIFKRKETSHNTAQSQITASASSVRNTARPVATISVDPNTAGVTGTGGKSGGKYSKNATITVPLSGYINDIASQWKSSAEGINITADIAQNAKAQNARTTTTLKDTKLQFNAGVTKQTVTYQLNGVNEDGKTTALMCTVTIDISALRKE